MDEVSRVRAACGCELDTENWLWTRGKYCYAEIGISGVVQGQSIEVRGWLRKNAYGHVLGADSEEWKEIRKAAHGLQYGKITITFQKGRITLWEKSESRRVAHGNGE